MKIKLAKLRKDTLTLKTRTVNSRKQPLRVHNTCSICLGEVSSHFFLKCPHPKCITCVDLEDENALANLYNCRLCTKEDVIRMKLFEKPEPPDEMLVYAYHDDATQKDIRKYKLEHQTPSEKQELWLKRMFKYEECLDSFATVRCRC